MQVFKIGIALGAGWEIGQALTNGFAYALNKKSRQHYRETYRNATAAAHQAAKNYTGPTVVKEDVYSGPPAAKYGPYQSHRSNETPTDGA